MFVLRLKDPVNDFSVMSGWCQHLLGLTSTVELMCQRDNLMTPVGVEHGTLTLYHYATALP